MMLFQLLNLRTAEVVRERELTFAEAERQNWLLMELELGWFRAQPANVNPVTKVYLEGSAWAGWSIRHAETSEPLGWYAIYADALDCCWSCRYLVQREVVVEP